MTPIKVLFFSYGGGHIDIVHRLFRCLCEFDPRASTIVALTTAAPDLVRRGLPHKRCINYLPYEGYEHAQEIGARLSKGLWNVASGIAWEESCAYMGISMCDLIVQEGEAAAWTHYKREGRNAFCPRRFAGMVIDIEEPSLVVTTCNARMERAANLEARERGLRSVRIEDLFGYSVLGPYTTQRPPVLAPPEEWPDDLIVMNDFVAETVAAAGFPAARIHVLGQPVLSEWAASYADAPVAGALQDWAETGPPVVVYIAPPIRETLNAHAASFYGLAARRPDMRFCIKLHPSVSASEFFAAYPSPPTNLRVLAQEEIITVVRGADLSIVDNSTAGLLCAISGKPMLVLNETEHPEVLPYVSSGVARRVSDLGTLEEAIDAALARGNNSRTGAAPEVLLSRPDATPRIARWLLEQAGG